MSSHGFLGRVRRLLSPKEHEFTGQDDEENMILKRLKELMAVANSSRTNASSPDDESNTTGEDVGR